MMNQAVRKRVVAAAGITGCLLGGAIAAVGGAVLSLDAATKQSLCVLSSGLGGIVGSVLTFRFGKLTGQELARADRHPERAEEPTEH